MNADPLGPEYEPEILFLDPDHEGEVVATLVRRKGSEQCRRAFLYVHGFSDYFLQHELATRSMDAGYRFYALDLRKYGRSLRPHQTPNLCRSVRDYFEELDIAFDRIEQDGCESVVLCGHSTGGLICSLYADHRRPSSLRALVLNSPFFEFKADWRTRNIQLPLVALLASSRPLYELPVGEFDAYGKSLHRDHHGEWEFDLRWKPLTGFPVRAAWLAAIHQAHREVQAGLDIGVPILVLHASRSASGRTYSDTVKRADVVLDVAHMRRYGPGLGKHVTLIAIRDAVHDVFLSTPKVRDEAYGQMYRWLSTYG